LGVDSLARSIAALRTFVLPIDFVISFS